jgi:hypothetical protein
VPVTVLPPDFKLDHDTEFELPSALTESGRWRQSRWRHPPGLGPGLSRTQTMIIVHSDMIVPTVPVPVTRAAVISDRSPAGPPSPGPRPTRSPTAVAGPRRRRAVRVTISCSAAGATDGHRDGPSHRTTVSLKRPPARRHGSSSPKSTAAAIGVLDTQCPAERRGPGSAARHAQSWSPCADRDSDAESKLPGPRISDMAAAGAALPPQGPGGRPSPSGRTAAETRVAVT